MADVATPSKWYTDNAPRWARCRAAVAGSDEVKALGQAIMPNDTAMDDEEFAGYLSRATYMNATQRSIDALVGMVMQKPAQSDIPPRIADLASNIDGRGAKLEDFTRAALTEVLKVGGGLAVVDHPDRPEGIEMADQERAIGLRPFVSWYALENILEYRTATINGEEQISFLKLSEQYEEFEDEWTLKEMQQVRVYDMDETGVRVRVFRQIGGKWAVYGDELRPQARNGQRLQIIPAAFFGPVTNHPGKPPMLDLVDMNLAHFCNSADHERILHFVGLPTPVVSGVDPDTLEGAVRLGSNIAYVFEDADAKISFAQVEGDKGVIGVEMEAKERRMAALGAQMLAKQTLQAESGDALAIKRQGENSALSTLADSVSRSIALVLGILGMWEVDEGDISYSLNTEFLPGQMSAQEITAIMGAVQGGLMSAEEAFDALQSGGVVRDDKMFEEHEAELIGAEPLDVN